MIFKDLGLSKPLLKVIEEVGYKIATPIQEQAIPVILENRDVLGIAQTGTGKTAAFSLPIIDSLIKNEKVDGKIKVLILSPTRELAIQTRDNIKSFTKDTMFKCSVVLGGVNQTSQIKVIKNGIDILVATPGRLVDLCNRHIVDLSNVKYLVLDEADTMLDMGFIKDVKYLISKTPVNRQTLLFSATMPKEMKELSDNFLKNPISISVTPEATTVDKINQQLYHVEKRKKFTLLLEILDNSKDLTSALIFTRTKHGANKLQEQFEKENIKCSVIHGNKSQPSRIKALNEFKTGKTKILIATDIAARGIDINELSHVINYDMPEHPEVYVHRIGRTARAGLSGTSISLCANEELVHLKEIEKLIKRKIDVIISKNYSTLKVEEPIINDIKKFHKGKTDNRSYNKKKNNKPNYSRNSKFSDNNKYSKKDDLDNNYKVSNKSKKNTKSSLNNGRRNDVKNSKSNNKKYSNPRSTSTRTSKKKYKQKNY